MSYLNNLQKAQKITKFLLVWHNTIGKNILKQRKFRTYQKYLDTLEKFNALDLDNPKNISQISEEQTSGVFEAAYCEEISEDIWIKEIQNVFPDLAKPTHIGGVGILLRELIKTYEFESTFKPFTLSADWEEKPILTPESMRLVIKPNESRGDALRRHFSLLSNIST